MAETTSSTVTRWKSVSVMPPGAEEKPVGGHRGSGGANGVEFADEEMSELVKSDRIACRHPTTTEQHVD